MNRGVVNGVGLADSDLLLTLKKDKKYVPMTRTDKKAPVADVSFGQEGSKYDGSCSFVFF